MRLPPAVSVLVVIAIMAGPGAGRGTGDDSQSIQQAPRPGAGLWLADGPAYGAVCGGKQLLDCATVKGYQPAVPLLRRLHSDAGGELIGRGILCGCI